MQQTEEAASHKSPADSTRPKLAPLVFFFALSYALIFASVLGVEYEWFTLPAALRSLLSVGSPTVAAFTVVLVTEGWPGLRQILVQYLRFRVPVRWYLLGTLFFVVPLAYGAVRLATGNPEFTAISFSRIPEIVLMTLLIGPLSEEGGWRGYALPRLLRFLSPPVAGALLGLLWGAWHIPFWFVEGSYQQQIPIIGYLVASIFLSIIYTKVYIATRESLVAVIHLHFCVNFAGSLVMRRMHLVSNPEFLALEMALVLVVSVYMLATWRRAPK